MNSMDAMGIDKMRVLLDAYGIGVRGGVITPCIEDENEFRRMMGLPDAPESVIAEWARTKGVRLPITLQRGLGDPVLANEGGAADEV